MGNPSLSLGMDIVTLAFYAVICGALGLIAPNLGRPVFRLGVGAFVGIVAASVLPMIRGFVGY